MATNYQVKQGDCISSIAFEYGFFPDTIWNHPNNAELKEERKDPNVLMPGDIVFIPDIRQKEVNEPTNQVHKFTLKGVPAKLLLNLNYGGEPIKNEPYTLDIDGNLTEGETDNEGKIRLSIPPNAEKGKLLVGTGERQIEYNLKLGRLTPIDKVSGVKKRLHNLGYNVGKIDEKVTEELENAIRAFEAEYELEQTGQITEENCSKLEEVYGC